jgi:hypothetical protein
MEGSEDQSAGKRSAWMSHVKKTMKAHKGMKLKDVLKVAKKTYKKSKKGGALSPMPLSGGAAPLTPASVGGRRRRGSRKSRGTRKH